MDHYSLLIGSSALLALWHTALDRPMTEEQVRRMYADKPRVLVMDLASATRWAAHRVRRAEDLRVVMAATDEARGLAMGVAGLN